MDNKIDLPKATSKINIKRRYSVAAVNGIPNELTVDMLKEQHLLPVVQELLDSVKTEVKYPTDEERVDVDMSASFVVLDKATFDSMVEKLYATE